jgi:hypothetical protein
LDVEATHFDANLPMDTHAVGVRETPSFQQQLDVGAEPLLI